MEIFDLRYYKWNKISLSCLGLWSFQNRRKKLVSNILIFSSIISTLYFQFNFLFDNWSQDQETVLGCLGPLVIIIMCLCQLSIYSFNEDKLLFLVSCIKNDWHLWSNANELKILRDHAEIGRSYTVISFAYIVSAVMVFIMSTFIPCLLDVVIPLNESRALKPVYPVKFFFDEEKYFNYILIHGCLTATYNLSIMFTCDAMFAVTTQHACGLFAIISYKVKNVQTQSAKGKKFLYKDLCYSIQYHNYAIRYANALESFYSPFLFFTNGCNLILVSITLMQTLNSADNIAYVLKFGAFAMANIYHTYVLGLPAQNLLNESFNVATNLYDSNWYEWPIKVRKLVPMIIMQSYRPCKLSIGKMATMDMQTVSELLKMSLSYFTMLASIHQTSTQ